MKGYKIFIDKIFKIILAFVMIISIVFYNIRLVNAISAINWDNYPRKDVNTYNGKITYDGTTVGDFSVNGQQAFCMAHPLTTPATGVKLTSEIYHNSDVQKVLYYGWGGPEQWDGFKSRAHGIVVTSLTLSYYYYYYGDNSSPSKTKDFINYIKSKSVPNFELDFSKPRVTAYKSGNIQRTESIVLNSGANVFSVTISLQDNVTYVDENSGSRQTGGLVTVKGKTKFHLEAPLSAKLDQWNTGEKTSGYKFSPIISTSINSIYQPLGSYEYTYDPSKTTSLTVDWLQLASLELTKTDVYGNLINGAMFRLWNNDGYDKNVTVSGGKIKVENLTTGIYYLQEVSAPHGYLLDDTIYTVTLNAGDTGKQTVSNKEPVGKITVIKESDNKDRIIGAKFNVIADGNITSAGGKLLYNSGDIVDSLVTGNDGTAVTKNLPLGNYIVYETQAPQGYLLNNERYHVGLKYANQTTPVVTTSSTIEDKEPLGSIELQKKINSEITDHQIGDSFLSQVEFGLYAKENITNAAGTKVFYQKDQFISRKITDEKGHIRWSELPMGKYYLKELSTNPSMILNPKVIDIILSYQNQSTTNVTVQTETENVTASQRIQIFKEGTKEGIAGIVQGLEGAEFTFVLNNDYEKVGYEKAHKYFIGTTDKNGYLTTSLLPYGTYRVKETKTPKGYYGASDFLITVEKDSSLYEVGYKIKKVTVNNVPFESLLKIVKKDKETGKTIAVKGATFKVKNLDKDEYISYIDWSLFPNINVNKWTTHEDGSITLNTKLKEGHYQLEEIEAPNGYLLSKDPIPFVITQDQYDISSDNVTPITVVELLDQSAKGKVTLEKKGEVLVDFKDGQFIYEERGIAHAQFEIYAKEDILDPSHDGTVLYKQGELVETLETTEGGKITSKALPLGNYECQEIKAPYGYVLNNEPKSFSLTYEGQLVDIVYEKVGVVDERQKLIVKVSKQDEETKEYLDGAEISLFANRDIYNYDEEIIVKAGTLLKTVNSSKDGSVALPIDLPLDLTPEYAVMPLFDEDYELIGDSNALYVVKETKQPDGYLSKNLCYYIDAQYTNDQDQALEWSYDFMNHITETMIHKIDAETLKDIAGAKLQIIDKETQKVVDEWISSAEGHIVKGLVVGKRYILHETQAPEGYLLSGDQEFEVYDREDMQTITFVNTKAPVITLGDEPEVLTPVISVQTVDQTIVLSYLIMGIGAISILSVLFKKKDEKKNQRR